MARGETWGLRLINNQILTDYMNPAPSYVLYKRQDKFNTTCIFKEVTKLKEIGVKHLKS